jgi:hypothetical protein
MRSGSTASKAAQEFVQGAENLPGQFGGDGRLRVTAALQQRRQATVGGVGEQAE